MGTDNKDKKRKYEPPKVYELETDKTQAMGQSLCQNGRQAVGPCDQGQIAGGSCDFGRRAGSQCGWGLAANISGECNFGLFVGWIH